MSGFFTIQPNLKIKIPGRRKESDKLFNTLKYFKLSNKRVIGYGLMGIVRLAKLKDCNGYFAIKSIRKDYVKRHHDDRHIRNEKEILMKLRSFPFCITFSISSFFNFSANNFNALHISFC